MSVVDIIKYFNTDRSVKHCDRNMGCFHASNKQNCFKACLNLNIIGERQPPPPPPPSWLAALLMGMSQAQDGGAVQLSSLSLNQDMPPFFAVNIFDIGIHVTVN